MKINVGMLTTGLIGVSITGRKAIRLQFPRPRIIQGRLGAAKDSRNIETA